MMKNHFTIVDWLDGKITSDELKVYLESAVMASKPVIVELPQ